MPFPDELARGLAVAAYDRRWPGDFAVLASRIQDALGPAVVRVSERPSNIHLVEAASEAARRKLLFRDFLRAHDAARDAWGDFKQRLAAMAADIYQYGQAKAGPTRILLIAAESWARETQWAPG